MTKQPSQTSNASGPSGTPKTLDARVAELEGKIRGIETEKKIIYWVASVLIFIGLGTAIVGLFSNFFLGVLGNTEKARNAAERAENAAAIAEAASSETNIISKANSVLSGVLPKILEEREGCQILLPSSRLWLISGIHVAQNDVVRIRISGGVNTAISQLVLHDIEQTRSPYPWTHLPNDNISVPEVKIRSTKELIQPSAWYRDVLMFVAKDENEIKEILQNPKAAPEDRIINITPSANSWTDCETSWPISTSGVLCFIVNDEYPTDLESYQYNESQVAEYIKHMAEINQFFTNGIASGATPNLDAVDVARWALRFHFNPPASISAFRDWESNNWQNINTVTGNRIFYDDNIGDYLLQVRVKVEFYGPEPGLTPLSYYIITFC